MEFKAEDGTISPIQHSTLRKINLTVAEAYVVRSLKEAKRIMKGGDEVGRQ